MTIGRYQVIREIARSNDIVYEAHDPQMNRRVAVKELALAPELPGQARVERIERFYREARAAGALNHPHIVTIYEVGEDKGRYFIAMEFLEGQTLRERLIANGPLPLPEAVKVARALCDALDYAHRAGIVHRDIKPDNVHLLPGGQVKLTDFGIARILHESSLTVAGQVFGTPSYMSPEQIKGTPIDGRTDLYSLGIVLYEMITGKKPYTGDSVYTITHHILNDPLPNAPGATPALEIVLQRAAAKDPDSRFPNAVAFGEALEAVEGSRTGVFAALNRPLPALPVAAVPAPLAVPNPTIQYGAVTQLGLGAPVAPAPSAPAALAPIPVIQRGSYAWLWGGLGGAALVVVGFLLARSLSPGGPTTPSGNQSVALPQSGAPQNSAPPSSGDPLDQLINGALQKKGFGDLGSGAGAQATPSSPTRVASPEETAQAEQWIREGQALASQGRWQEAQDKFYWAKERAIGTETGNRATSLYNEAAGHSDLFGGMIKGR